MTEVCEEVRNHSVTTQRSQRRPVTPGLQRHWPVRGSHDSVPHREQTHSRSNSNTSVINHLSPMATPLNQLLTGAVFGTDGVSIETWSADVAVKPGCVVHAVQTLAGQRVTVGEQHVGVSVAIAITWLTLAAQHHRVAIVTRGTPVST